MKSARPNAGFTLVEILVAIAIIAILATFVGLNFFGETDKAKAVNTKQQLKTLMQAVALYEADNNAIPTVTQGLEALIQAPATDPVPPNYKQGGYLQTVNAVPKDGWGRPFIYAVPSIDGGKPFEILSYGKDGERGGDGVNADISCYDP